ncbi:hypothetical protein MPH_04486 [Macrophomina phaseolina MS6]|uniref:Uncharacterized protein n=1 Tax=Macrophomina phaseolina (strain MS6) TaxID=1126212 RepID=K2R7E0_MACPH|nr:hypothetical protein MPH_04486 [Macrophomina phaseolina MS6]
MARRLRVVGTSQRRGRSLQRHLDFTGVLQILGLNNVVVSVYLRTESQRCGQTWGMTPLRGSPEPSKICPYSGNGMNICSLAYEIYTNGESKQLPERDFRGSREPLMSG